MKRRHNRISGRNQKPRVEDQEEESSELGAHEAAAGTSDQSNAAELVSPECDQQDAPHMDADESSSQRGLDSSSGNRPNKKIKKYDPEWAETYPWLRYDIDTYKMYCTICEKRYKQKALNLSNPFVAGCQNLQVSSVEYHEKSSYHQEAILEHGKFADWAQGTRGAPVEEYFNETQQGLIKLMKLVIFLFRRDMALRHYTGLVELFSLTGVQEVQTFAQGRDTTYKSRGTAEELVTAIDAVVLAEEQRKLEQANYVSIIVHKNTSAGQRKLAVYARLSAGAKVETILLTNKGIDNEAAATVKATIMDIVKRRRIPHKKVIGVASDLGEVMLVEQTGVLAELTRSLNPYLVHVHCFTRPLPLFKHQRKSKVQQLDQVREALKETHRYFQMTPKVDNTLKTLKGVFMSSKFKVKDAHEMYWPACHDALLALHDSWSALVTHLDLSDSDSANKLAIRIKSASFLSVMNFLLDVIPILASLESTLQKKDQEVGAIYSAVKRVRGEIQQIAENPRKHCPRLSKFLDDVSGNSNQKTLGKSKSKKMGKRKSKTSPKADSRVQDIRYKDIAIDCNVPGGLSYEDEVLSTTESFAANIIKEIDSQFSLETINVVTALSILSLEGLAAVPEAEVQDWGTEHINTLVEKYGRVPEGAAVDEGWGALIDGPATRQEWGALKALVREQHLQSGSKKTLWPLIAEFHADKFLNLIILADIWMSLPGCVAEVRKSFNFLSTVQQAHVRNRLSNDYSLGTMFRIKSVNEGTFDFGQALKSYQDAKSRKADA